MVTYKLSIFPCDDLTICFHILSHSLVDVERKVEEVWILWNRSSQRIQWIDERWEGLYCY